MFQVKFTAEANEDLRRMRKFDRVKIAEAIRTQLAHQPNQPSQNRKRLRPNPLAEWQLRIGDFRVIYDVDAGANQVSIAAIGRKDGDKLWVHGREFKL